DNTSLETRLWWEGICEQLRLPMPLAGLAPFCSKIISDIVVFKKAGKSNEYEIPEFLDSLLDSLEQAATQSKSMVQKDKEIQFSCRKLIKEMDFNLLYDPVRKLFSIGMRVNENQLDPSYYDLLASEARLTSF